MSESESDLLDIVRESGAFDSDEEAESTIAATLRALGACLSSGERRDIAEPLPERYAASVREPDGGEASPPDVDSFVERVRTDAAIVHPKVKIRAVLAALTEVVGEDEMADAQAQLPPGYGELFEPATLEPETTFVDVVADEGGFDHDTAETAARETLAVLGRRLSAGEASDIAPYLRGEAGEVFSRKATHDAEAFGPDEFRSKLARRADVSEERAGDYADAVADALVEAVPESERERAEAQLPEQYAAVIDLDG